MQVGTVNYKKFLSSCSFCIIHRYIWLSTSGSFVLVFGFSLQLYFHSVRVEERLGNLPYKNHAKKILWKDSQMKQIWCPMIGPPRPKGTDQDTVNEKELAGKSQGINGAPGANPAWFPAADNSHWWKQSSALQGDTLDSNMGCLKNEPGFHQIENQLTWCQWVTLDRQQL